MKTILISIKDSALDAFLPIGTVRHESEAIRAFNNIVNDPQNQQMHNHPEDFELYVIGYFDDNTGRLEGLEAPRQIARGKDVKLKGA